MNLIQSFTVIYREHYYIQGAQSQIRKLFEEAHQKVIYLTEVFCNIRRKYLDALGHHRNHPDSETMPIEADSPAGSKRSEEESLGISRHLCFKL